MFIINTSGQPENLKVEEENSASAENEHRDNVSAMFGRIAEDYDFLNHLLSMGIDLYWRKALIRAAAPHPVVLYSDSLPPCILDLAAGTFDVSLALAEAYPDFYVLGMDLCLPMLQKGLPKLARAEKRAERKSMRAARSIAREQSRAMEKSGGIDSASSSFQSMLDSSMQKADIQFVSPHKIQPVGGDAFALPLHSESIDSITISFGLRNMQPRAAAFAEFLRVLKPGGKLCVLEFGSARRKVWFGLYNFYLFRILPFIGGIVSGDRSAYAYLAESIEKFPLAHELVAEMQEAGFKDVGCQSLSSGIVYLHTASKAV